MRLQRQSNGQIITLDKTTYLDRGGEGEVHKVEGDLVAKTYHTPTQAAGRKLAAMVASPPDDPMRGSGHITIAWPVDLLLTTDAARTTVGFLMPFVTGMASLDKLYIPKSRRQHYPLFNWLYLHRTARNIAAAVQAIHARGYVIGDINESNIRVADTALVTLLDTDSFQVREPLTGAVYRCPVGKAEFMPPELQGKNLRDIDREPSSDLFALAVLIFQLLMEGTHPFAGVYSGAGEAPPIEARIAAGHFPQRADKKSPYSQSPTAPPYEILHPKLRGLFHQCFADGHSNPKARPDAAAWLNALEQAEDLSVCARNEQHYYGKHLPVCPWCERAALLGGHDPFPSRQSVKAGSHLPKAKVKQKPLPPVYNPAVPPQRGAGRGTTQPPYSPSARALSATGPAVISPPPNAAAGGHPLPILYMLERRARRRRRITGIISGIAAGALILGSLAATGHLPGFSSSAIPPAITERTTKVTHVPHKTRWIKTSTLPAGARHVSQQGVDGVTDVVSEVTSRNGVTISSTIIDKTVKQAPVTEIILVGAAEGQSGHHAARDIASHGARHAASRPISHGGAHSARKTVPSAAHTSDNDLHSQSTIGNSLH